MTAREFREWLVYDAVEGLPDRRADWRAGMLASVSANPHRKKGTRALTPMDFMPRDPAVSKPGRSRQPIGTFFDYLDARAARDASR